MRLVLFICTGNSCRSVMAQAVCERLLRERGMFGADMDKQADMSRGVLVMSAGVAALNGMTSTFETRSVLRHAGMHVTGHRAKRLTDDMIERAELLLVMEQAHRHEIIRRQPNASSKVFLLRTFGLDEHSILDDPNVPDPIGRSFEDYQACLETVTEGVVRVVNHLEATCKSR